MVILFIIYTQKIFINYFLGEKRKTFCPCCDSSIVVQIEEPLPSSSNNLTLNSETDEQNSTEEEDSNESTPINSRSSKIRNVCYITLYNFK